MTQTTFAAILAAMIAGAPLAAGAQEAQQEPPIGGEQDAPSVPEAEGPPSPDSATGERDEGEVQDIREGLTDPGQDVRDMGHEGYGRSGYDYLRDAQGMRHHGMSGGGTMDRGMRRGMVGDRAMSGGHGMMGHGGGHGMMGGMRMMMILMDTDGDGALSLEEVQAVHERVFRAIDADGDDRVTLEEIRSFMRNEE